MSALYMVGDVFDRLAELRRRRVRVALVLCSPPFLALRSYLPDGHPLKRMEIGSEATPAAFVDVMLALVAECAHVLAPWGSVALELGDTYAGSGGAGGDYDADGLRAGQNAFDGSGRRGRNRVADDGRPTTGPNRGSGNGIPRPGVKTVAAIGPGWPLAKSLAGIPEAVMLSLAYGYNVLDRSGPDSPAGRWMIRNFKPWIRSNPPVGALGDKERPATSYVIVATRDPQRFFDLDAVRTHSDYHRESLYTNRATPPGQRPNGSQHTTNAAGAPPRDWCHSVDMVLDAELDRMAGKTSKRADVGAKRRETMDGGELGPYDGGTTGARGVHLRRALERAGILTTLDAIDQSPKGYRGAHYACVDDQTEALTPGGWRRHDQLTDGDLIAVWFPDAETWRFEPATFHRYPFSGDLVAINKRVTTQRLTPNHRVAYRTRKDPTPRFREADTLTAGCQLPLAAPMEAGGVGPGEKAAALAGWFCSEGAIVHGRPVIYQSESANPAHVQHLRSLLDGLGADYTERTRHRTGVTGKPHVVVAFTVRGGLGEWLRQFHKSLPMSAVFGWSEIDAAALFDALIDGDGHRRPDGRCSFIQKDQAVAERVQMLAVRLGYRSTLTTHSRDGCYTVHVSPGRWVDLRAGSNGERPAVGTEHYEGVVWCPSVSTGAWLARRGGQPFVTGNTWPPELVRLLVDEMCPRRVCSVCGQPSRRITVDRSAFARQPELAAHIRERREALGVTPAEVNGWFGYKEIAKNWERTDRHGAAIPNAADWPVLAERLGLDRERFDDLVMGERRWTESTTEYVDHRSNGPKAVAAAAAASGSNQRAMRAVAVRSDLGWSDCGCPGADRWQPGTVLDPFVGSGTTLQVCSGMGRESIGIDLDYTNVELAIGRVGLFLDVEWPEPDLVLLSTRALGPGSPHPAYYDRWAARTGDAGRRVRHITGTDDEPGLPRSDAPPPPVAQPRPKAQAAPAMAGQGGLFD